MTKMQLTPYVKDVVKEYGISDTRTDFNRIRNKFMRELQKIDLWDNANQADDVSRTKSFNLKDLDTIKQRLHNYLQENNKEAIERAEIKRKKEYAEAREKLKQEQNERQQKFDIMKYRQRMHEERCKITDEMKRDIMLEALYNMYFEDVDVEQWYSDIVTMDKFYTDNLRVDYKGQPRRDKTRPERAASKRLENRAQSYCKKKVNENER